MRRGIVLLLAALGLTIAAPPTMAIAAVTPEMEATFSYESPPPCEHPLSYLEAVKRRLPSLLLVPGGTESIVSVTLRTVAGATEATIVVVRENEEPLRRTIRASSCGEALEVIAFITAVAFDPNAPVDRELAGRGGPTGDTLDAEEEMIAERAQSSGEQESKPQKSRLASRSSASYGFLSAVGSVTSGKVPGSALGGEVAAMVGVRGYGMWAPALRLGLGYQRGQQVEEQGKATFDWYGATLDACPVEWRTGRLSFRPCAQTAFGMVHAKGIDTFNASESRRVWVQVGLSGRVAVALGGPLFLWLGGGVGVPLIRDSYQFDNQDFYRVSPFVGTGSLGIELQYW